MKENEIFERFRVNHPEWSDEQVWVAVAIDIQQDVVIDQRSDIDPNNPDIWREIIIKAKDWLQKEHPIIFDKTKDCFSRLMDDIKEKMNQDKK